MVASLAFKAAWVAFHLSSNFLVASFSVAIVSLFSDLTCSFSVFFFLDAFKVLQSTRGDQYHALLRNDPLILAGLLGKLLKVRLLVDAVWHLCIIKLGLLYRALSAEVLAELFQSHEDALHCLFLWCRSALGKSCLWVKGVDTGFYKPLSYNFAGYNPLQPARHRYQALCERFRLRILTFRLFPRQSVIFVL